MADSWPTHPGGAQVSPELPPEGKRDPLSFLPFSSFLLAFAGCRKRGTQAQNLFLKLLARCLAALGASLNGGRSDYRDGEQVSPANQRE